MTAHPSAQALARRRTKSTTNSGERAVAALAVRFGGTACTLADVSAAEEWKRLLRYGQRVGRARREREGLFGVTMIHALVWALREKDMSKEARGQALDQLLKSSEFVTGQDLSMAFEAGRWIGAADVLKAQDAAGQEGGAQ